MDLGIVPEAGSSVLLPRKLGLQRASELLLGGRFFDAAEAERWGLVNRLVEVDDLEPEALSAAAMLAAKPATALAKSRALIRGDVEALIAVIDREFDAFGEALASPETQALMSAASRPRA